MGYVVFLSLGLAHHSTRACNKLHDFETFNVRPPFLRFTKFKFCFVDLLFFVFFRFLSKTVQTDQNLPFF